MLMEKIRQAVRSGKKPKEAIAMALSEKRKMKMMSQGGMVDENDPGDMAVVGGGLPKDESMSEMADFGADSQIRNIGELNEASQSLEPSEVSNPSELAEAVMRYAMGGLVQAGPEEDQRLHGNQPEESMMGGSEEPMSSMPMKPMGPSKLSEAAKRALEMKKKSRRYS